MELFYVPVAGNMVTLSPEESRHCVKVLRHKKGDIIHLIDGQGNMYEAEIVQPDTRGTVVEIKEKHSDFGRVPYNLDVALPPLKSNARYEWFVEKVTEIGVTGIIPVITKYAQKNNIKPERLEKILISAAKQSLRAFLPKLFDPQLYSELIIMDYEQKFIALCDAKNSLIDVYQEDKKTLILIGPEGGFSDGEREQALNAGFVPIKIGHSRLRAETAAVVATGMVANLNLF